MSYPIYPNSGDDAKRDGAMETPFAFKCDNTEVSPVTRKGQADLFPTTRPQRASDRNSTSSSSNRKTGKRVTDKALREIREIEAQSPEPTAELRSALEAYRKYQTDHPGSGW